MAGKTRHFLERDGRFYARLVVPKSLRPVIGKAELTEPLGPDRRQALRKLPSAVARFQKRLADGRTLVATNPKPEFQGDALNAARQHYKEALAFDEELRDSTHLYARHGFFDEFYIERLKNIAAGKADREETSQTLQIILRKFRATDPASPGWRRLTRLLAQAELAALNVAMHRDEGDEDPPPPAFLNGGATEPLREAISDTSIRKIFESYRLELQATGRGRNAESRWAPIVDSLVNFIGHDQAPNLTRNDVVRWKDQLLKTLSPKTVRDSYLATARAAFGWAVDNSVVAQNPCSGIKVRLSRKTLSRERGFSDAEATGILKASRNYEGSARESLTMIAAKRWLPLLCAYTGARIGEIAQLRVEDVRNDSGINFARITPDAGTVKSGYYRDVPLHVEIIGVGFLDYVASKGSGPLFYASTTRTGKTPPASIVADRVAKWIRSLGIADSSVQPNHGWRHRFKTVATELGLNARVVDAIQGHSARTAGDRYGDITLKAKQIAIAKFPTYNWR